MNRRIIRVFVLLFLVPLQATAASPNPVNSEIKAPFQVDLQGTKETIQVVGKIHVVSHTATTRSGLRRRIHINLLDSSGIGFSSGTDYSVKGGFNGEIPADVETAILLMLFETTADAENDLRQMVQTLATLHFDRSLRLIDVSVEPLPCEPCD